MSESEIFSKIVHLDAAGRAAYLEEACGGNAKLRGDVEALLAAHETIGEFLADSPVQLAARDGGPGPETAGAVIAGRYTLLEKIGEGGMGEVWVAKQTEPVKRKVALKLIKEGMDSRGMLARFDQERQALALMDHPNIAKVLDGGLTPSRQPFFVMELVNGLPLAKFCDAAKMTPRERLELFVPICHAVQHAHQKGVVHRDLKPANILVTVIDGKPVPKVIDFGVAKAIGGKLTDESMATQFGAVVGTLEYISPEQAGFSGQDVDTRADIYSLGVVLYELLTGLRPFDGKRLRAAALFDMIRVIVEEEPSKPSTRLSTDESLPSMAALRQTEPKKLMALLRGELDWVVMKCLEKQRDRRYETASGLARDISRYLANEPVEARPHSATYRMRKFLQRNRGPVLAASLLLGALMAGIAGTTWGLFQARLERDAANTARDKEAAARKTAEEERLVAQSVQRFLQDDLLLQADANRQADALLNIGGDFRVTANPTVRDLLDRAAANLTPEKIETRFPSQPLVQANVLTTVGMSYRGVGDFKKSAELLRRAIERFRAALGPDNMLVQPVLRELAETLGNAGQHAEALKILEPLADLQRRTLPADDVGAVRVLKLLGITHWQLGQNEAAIADMKRVIDVRTRSLGPNHVETLRAAEDLGLVLQKQGKVSEALALFERVRDGRRTQLGAEHPSTLNIMHNIGLTYRDNLQYDLAIPMLEKVRDTRKVHFGPNHPSTITTESVLAAAYLGNNQMAEALPLLEKVYAARVASHGPENPSTLITGNDLASAYRILGRNDEAIALLTKVRAAQTAALGSDHPNTMVYASNLGYAYQAAGRLPEAIAVFEELLNGPVARLPADNRMVATLLSRLSLAYHSASRSKDAIVLLEAARKRSLAELGPAHSQTFAVTRSLAVIHDRVGNLPRCEELIRETVDAARTKYGAKSPQNEPHLGDLASTYLKEKKWADAESVLRELLAARDKSAPESWTTGNYKSRLGGALLEQKKYAEAEPLLLAGYEGLKSNETKMPKLAQPLRTDAVKRLEQLYKALGKPEDAAKWRQRLESERELPKSPPKQLK